MLQPGTTIAGYEIQGVLGHGGMGIVYEARQLSLNRVVALKLLSPQLGADDSFRGRFRREGEIQAAIDHPNIITVYEAGELEQGLFLAMRMVRGPTLKDLIIGRELEGARTLRILKPIADALDAAHEAGLIHRDIKPQNILVGARDHPYLADFGLTKMADDVGFTKTGQFVGTTDYVAPEQIRGEAATGATDVYALAGVLYECLTGVVPYPKPSDAAVLFAHMTEPPPLVTDQRPDLPAALDEVIARGMAKEPGRRQQHAAELIGEAERAFGRRIRAAITPPGPLEGPEETGIRPPEAKVPTRETRIRPVPEPPAPASQDVTTVPGADATRASAPAPSAPVDQPPPVEEPPAAGPTRAAEPVPPLSPPRATEPVPPAGPTRATEPVPPLSPPRATEPVPPAGPTRAAESVPPAGPTRATEPVPDAGPTRIAHPMPAARAARPAEPVPPISAAAGAGTPASGGSRTHAFQSEPFRVPRAEPAPRRPAPGAVAAAAVAVLGLAAVGGYLAGGSGGSDEPVAPEAALASSASSGIVGLHFPDGWRRAPDPPRIPGLELSQPVAVSAGAAAEPGIAAGRTQAGGPRLLPDEFVATLPRPPEPGDRVRLGDLQAIRYRGLRPEGYDRTLTVFVVGTTRGVATVACHAPAAAAAAFARDCERVAAGLELTGAKAYTLGPQVDYARTLDRETRALARARARDRRALAGARTPAGQARLASGLATVHRRSAARLAGVAVAPADRPSHAALVAALRRTAAGYDLMASAARRADRGDYRTGRRRVRAGERDLQRALAGLERLGYDAR